MNGKKMIFGVLLTASIMSSCNQAQQQEKEQTDKIVTLTNDSVQKVIEDLGLVYVEEGAQTIITYDEVNAAQQA